MKSSIVFLTILLCAVLGTLSSSYASSDVSMKNVLDVSKFQTREQFSEAVDLYIKDNGTNALEEKLINDWSVYRGPETVGWSSSSVPSAIFKQGFCKYRGYESRQHVGNENYNLARIAFSSCMLVFKNHRVDFVFDDHNFVNRSVPFRFEYFDDSTSGSSKRVSDALKSLHQKFGLSALEGQLIQAGAILYYSSDGSDSDPGKGYRYRPTYRHLGSLSSVWNISLWMDQNGSLKNISANRPHIVMP